MYTYFELVGRCPFSFWDILLLVLDFYGRSELEALLSHILVLDFNGRSEREAMLSHILVLDFYGRSEREAKLLSHTGRRSTSVSSSGNRAASGGANVKILIFWPKLLSSWT
jgi:hypothetical protein